MKRFTLVSSTRGVNWRWGVELISRVWEKENLACKPRRSRRVSSSATSRTGVRKNEGAAAPPSASRRLNYPVKKKKKKNLAPEKKKKKKPFFSRRDFFAAESSVAHPGRTGAARTGVKRLAVLIPTERRAAIRKRRPSITAGETARGGSGRLNRGVLCRRDSGRRR